MGFISHQVHRNDLVEGDHIYVYRARCTYSHHGIYVGQDKVIHFNVNKKPCSPPTSCLDPECGFRKSGSGVFKSCLDCFLGNKQPHRYQYGLNPIQFRFKIRVGTCTCVESDPPEIVIHRAKYLLDHGFGQYHLIKNNCEDFALYCKTGLLSINGNSCSHQVNGTIYNAFAGASLILSAVFIVPITITAAAVAPPAMAAIPPGMVASWGAFTFINGAYMDIHHFPGVVKVEVENVHEFRDRNAASS